MTALTRTLAIAGCALFALLAIACNGGDDADPTATAGVPTEAPSTSTPDPEPTVDSIIRELDLAAVPEVAALVTDTGGEIVQANVLYADLTEDSIEEALVPLASGGTSGMVAFVVLTPEGDGARVLLTETAGVNGLAVGVNDDGTLEMVEPVPGVDDPECCPSMLRRTTYAWNGEALAIADVTTEQAPFPKTPAP